MTVNGTCVLANDSDFEVIGLANGSVAPTKLSWNISGNLQVPLYTLILMLAIVGNVLVISTLVQNRRMRTITNLFLLNLAVSDILLGVLCMPFTLVGTILRHFVFGEMLCKLIPFMQATSVAVSSWTLVAISCERYYAICHPFRSRSWQTLRHAYKIIVTIWAGSLLCMAPISGFSKLIPTSTGHQKCREKWPDSIIMYERAYNIFLDIILLVLPLIILCVAYCCITRTLYKGINDETLPEKDIHTSRTAYRISGGDLGKNETNTNQFLEYGKRRSALVYPDMRVNVKYIHTSSDKWFDKDEKGNTALHGKPKKEGTVTILDKHLNSYLRRTNAAKSLENKKRVLKMLFVLVLEFFICWTPLYVINTITLFDSTLIYDNLSYTAISFFQLLAYSSSCCNPITYCFMNASFRKAFLDTFNGLRVLVYWKKK